MKWLKSQILGELDYSGDEHELQEGCYVSISDRMHNEFTGDVVKVDKQISVKVESEGYFNEKYVPVGGIIEVPNDDNIVHKIWDCNIG